MKTALLKGITLALLAVTAIACNNKMEAPAPEVVETVDAANIKTQIQDIETAYATAMNAGKVDEVVYYATDATSYSQERKPFVGKKAIYQNLEAELATLPESAKVAYATNEIFPSIDGSQVVELGSYTTSDATGNIISSGNFMAMFEKRNGRYFCVRDMSLSDTIKTDK
jgi:ketosteroid isomerase-like protein